MQSTQRKTNGLGTKSLTWLTMTIILLKQLYEVKYQNLILILYSIPFIYFLLFSALILTLNIEPLFGPSVVLVIDDLIQNQNNQYQAIASL